MSRTQTHGPTDPRTNRPQNPMRIAHIITRLVIGGAQENTVLTCEDLMRRYGNPGHLPFTLVFSADGTLLHRKTGVISPSELDHWLGNLLLKQ